MLVQSLAASDEGIRALRDAATMQKNDLRFIKSRAGHAYMVEPQDGDIVFGDGRTGRRMSSKQARKIVKQYFYNDPDEKS